MAVFVQIADDQFRINAPKDAEDIDILEGSSWVPKEPEPEVSRL